MFSIFSTNIQHTFAFGPTINFFALLQNPPIEETFKTNKTNLLSLIRNDTAKNIGKTRFKTISTKEEFQE